MPNILLTQRCVRTCPYCFAKKHMSESLSDDMLSWKNLIYIADLIENSGERNISLLGGEPTLHPKFIDFVIYLIERNFNIVVFTSGIMSEKLLHEASTILARVPEERLSFVCNLNDPKQSPIAENESVKRFLERFGHRTSGGFNIYQKNFDIGFLFQYINRYGLKRNVRLGMAHPIPGLKNKFVAIEEMRIIIERLFSYAPTMERLRIKPGFDCGFTMCLLNDTQLGWLYRLTGGTTKFGCGPAIDIGPEMSVWSCFPLSSFHKRSVFEFDSMNEIRHFYMELHKKVRIEVGGIFEECDDCKYREEGSCQGGCLGHILSRFQNEANIRMPEIYV
ncbi:MAG: radical SAM protein [Nitrospirae bacterium]|nr:radical SAM protein [Nitrospirota bacterium]